MENVNNISSQLLSEAQPLDGSSIGIGTNEKLSIGHSGFIQESLIGFKKNWHLPITSSTFEVSESQNSTFQISSSQFSVLEHSTFESSIAEVSQSQVSSFENGYMGTGISNISSTQISLSKSAATQISSLENGIREIAPSGGNAGWAYH